ncbi:Nif3-like dinuclear metal center hexameric protein [Methanosarcina sp.]|uniref:Nif3-like dinuclear metal center hexameric protein n=1 Tax=Methanosarcina sp. TaxID=2213 RepID=UPI003BB77DC9
MELVKIVEILEEIAPPELADDFDEGRIGVILDLEREIKRIVVALDANSYILKKAAEMRADLLITHHTLIFHPINKISKPLAASLKLALENGISLYSMHTNYDRADGGINDVLAARIGLKNIEILEIGRIGEIEPCSSSELATHVSECLQTPVMYAGEKEIRRVMIFGGSGFREEFLEIARANKADAFVSSELKHDILRNYEDLCLIDATHYATENPGMEELCSRLRKLPGIEVEFIEQPSGLRAIDRTLSRRIKDALDVTEEKTLCEQKEMKKDSMESMIEEQSRNQVRSDYRRSLGSESRRKYME